MIDMYIDNAEPSENVGQIHFCVEYDFQNTTLILKILQVIFGDPILFYCSLFDFRFYVLNNHI